VLSTLQILGEHVEGSAENTRQQYLIFQRDRMIDLEGDASLDREADLEIFERKWKRKW
jgi:hypothetical protein